MPDLIHITSRGIAKMSDPATYKLIAFDVDGTLRRCTVPGQPCPNKPGEWEVIPGVEARIAALGGNARLVMVTNQGGIGLGHLSATTASLMLHGLAEQLGGVGARWSAIYTCPHAPDAGCVCRKPSPYMLWRAIQVHDLRPSDTLYVGDMGSDKECAERAGVDFAWARDFFRWEAPCST